MEEQIKQQPKMSPELFTKIKDAFDSFEKEHQGYILSKDLPYIFERLGKKVTEAEIADMTSSIAQEPQQQYGGVVSKRIEFQKFLQLMLYKQNEFIMKEQLIQAFKVFDPEGTGQIATNYFRYIMRQYGQQLAQDEAQQIIKQGQPSDDKIRYQGFIDKMLKGLGITLAQ